MLQFVFDLWAALVACVVRTRRCLAARIYACDSCDPRGIPAGGPKLAVRLKLSVLDFVTAHGFGGTNQWLSPIQISELLHISVCVWSVGAVSRRKQAGALTMTCIAARSINHNYLSFIARLPRCFIFPHVQSGIDSGKCPRTLALSLSIQTEQGRTFLFPMHSRAAEQLSFCT